MLAVSIGRSRRLVSTLARHAEQDMGRRLHTYFFSRHDVQENRIRFLFFCSDGVVEEELVLCLFVVAPEVDDKSGDPSSPELAAVRSMAPPLFLYPYSVRPSNGQWPNT